MPTEYIEAVDQMFELFKTDWDANTTSIVGYVPEVRWPNVEEPEIPPKDLYWARVNQMTVSESQLAFCETVEKVYNPMGLIIVQLFCPKSNTESSTKGRELSMIVKKAYRGKKTAGGVWFRNVRIEEMKVEMNFYRFNIVAEYEYNEKG